MGCRRPVKCEIYFGKLPRKDSPYWIRELRRDHAQVLPFLFGLFLLRFRGQLEPFSLGDVSPPIRENRTERRREPATLCDVQEHWTGPSLSRIPPGIQHLDLQPLFISNQLTLYGHGHRVSCVNTSSVRANDSAIQNQLR